MIMSVITHEKPRERRPAWEVATLFPDQGHWGAGDYLALTHSTNRLVELSDGRIEILPMPTMAHQLIVQYLSNLLLAFASTHNLGRVLFAPLRVRLPNGNYREPDVVFMLFEHAARMGDNFWDGADLVMEVVSEDNREHDLVTKRAEYAAAGIPEYWIVDPSERKITILKLQGDHYTTHADGGPGQKTESALLSGFSVEVSAVWAAAAAD
jgi:Uma2 family endonuclease